MKYLILKKSTIPKGYESWKIDYDNGLKEFDPSDLTLHFEPEQNDSYVKGEILAERLKGKAYNASVLDYLLEHPDLIPKNWKDKLVFFWGTIYRNAAGDLGVRYLHWHDSQWYWLYRYLGSAWGGDNPAAVPSESFALEPQHSNLVILSLEKRLAEVEARLDKLKML